MNSSTHSLPATVNTRYWLKFLLVLLAVLTAPMVYGQAPAWQTALSLGQDTQSFSDIKATAVDASGNVYITGQFLRTITIGSTTLTSTTSPISSSTVYSQDIFIAKWSSATSRFIWALQAGGNGDEDARGIAVSGNRVYVVGNYTSPTVNFGNTTLTSAGSGKAFFAKIIDDGSAGTFTWALQAGGGTGNTYVNAVAVNGNDIYVTGASRGATFGNITIPSTGLDDIYVAKITDSGANGRFIWAQSAGGIDNNDVGASIAVNGSSVYISGSFGSSTVSFGSYALTKVGSQNMFVAKLTDFGSTSSFIWAQRAGAASFIMDGNAVGVSGSSVYVAGGFQRTATFGSITLNTAGGNDTDVYVVKLTDLGNSSSYVWGQRAGGSGIDGVMDLAVQGSSLYLAGYFFSPVAVFGVSSLTNAGYTDAFIAKVTDDGLTGSFKWGQQGGGANADQAWSVAITSGGTVYVSGSVTPSASIGSFTIATPTGGCQASFLASLNDEPAPSITSFTPSSAVAGASVTMTGLGLSGTTAVTVNGTAAVVTAATNTSLTFMVPTGAAASQSVTVITPAGTATSNAFTALLQVSSTAPAVNARTAPLANSAVALTFTEPVTVPSATGIKVHSTQVGGQKAGTWSISGNTASFVSSFPNIRRDFRPGELVSVSVPGTIRGSGGLTATKKVYRFTTAVNGPGRGNFTAPAINPNPIVASVYSVAVADVDGDGDLDFVTANLDNTASVRLNNGSGDFTAPAINPNPPIGTNAVSVAVGDVDGDGDIDFVTANNNGQITANGTVSVRLNNGTGSFTAPAISPEVAVGGAPQRIIMGDVDGDGDLDFLTPNGNNSVSVRLNNGNGAFSGGSELAMPSSAWDLALGDVDGDGDLDLLTSCSDVVYLRLNDGIGNFSIPVGNANATTSRNARIAVGDVDGDGDLDLLTASQNNTFVSVRLNDGSGTFTPPTINPEPAVGTILLDIAMGDVDGDGDLDFLTANGSGTVSVRFNDGTGNFTPPSTNPDPTVSRGPYSMALGDVDGDGDLDFLTANHDDVNPSNVSVRLNQLFAPTITSFTPSSGRIGTSVVITGTNLTSATNVSFNGTAQTVITNNTATGLTVNVPVGATSGYISMTNAGGTATSTQLFTVIAAGPLTWTGAVSTDWNAPGNWSTNRVPVATDDVVIPSATPYQPTVSAMQALHALTINSGATVTLANTAAATLAVGGNFVNNGSLVNPGPDGLLLFNGNALQTVNGTSTTAVSTLQVGVGAVELVLNSPVQVSRLLEVNQTLTSNGYLTLLSDRTGTALVHNVGAGVVLGTATVQRAVAPNAFATGAAYRHFSSPVAATTIADFATPGFTPVVNSLYNTNPDPSRVQPFPTVFGYEQTRLATVARSTYGTFDKGWFSPAAVTDRLEVGRGYSLHINAAQTVDFVGTLNTGNYTLNLARNTGPTATEAGWALVGNPYPSPLDWTLVSPADRPGLDAALYVNEPIGPYSGHYSTNANGVGDNPRVASGQAFFVRVSQGQTMGQLAFRNSQRGTTPGDEHPFQRGMGETRPLVQLALQGTSGPADNLYLYAQAGATAAQDAGYDAMKLDNSSGLNLASVLATGEALAIDGRPEFANAAIPLRVDVPASGTYTLRLMQALNLPLGTTLLLTDALTGQQTDLRRQASYPFTVAAGAPANRRFWLNLTAGALATASGTVLSTLSVFPNPAQEHFTVLVPAVAGATTVQAELLNALGQVVRRQSATLTATGARIAVNATNLAVGVYSLRVQAGSSIMTKRIVIQ